MGHKIMSIRHLSMSDRSRIEVYLELGWSISRIAKEIKFSKQAISRVSHLYDVYLQKHAIQVK